MPTRDYFTLDFLREPNLQKFDVSLDNARVAGSKSGIVGVDFATRRIFDALYKNAVIQNYAAERLKEWSNEVAHPSMRQRLSQAFLALKSKRPLSKESWLLAWVYVSRRQRWARLTNRIGLRGVPDFVWVYRVLAGDEAVREMSKLWDRPEVFVPIKGYGLSSWSLMPGSAAEGALQFLGRSPAGNGILICALVPFEQSVFDKWVDDADLVARFPRECEIILGSWPQAPILFDKRNVVIYWEGNPFLYDQRHALKKLL